MRATPPYVQRHATPFELPAATDAANSCERELLAVLEECPLSEPDRRMLARLGVDRSLCASIGLGSLSDGLRARTHLRRISASLLLMPVRDADRRLRTIRVLDGARPFTSVYDLATLLPSLRAERARGLEGEYSILPHVAYAATTGINVLLVEDDLTAVLAAHRLGITAVSTVGGRIPLHAALLAVRRLGARQLTVAIAPAHSGNVNRALRLALAWAGAVAPDVRIADWDHRVSFGAWIAGGGPMMTRPSRALFPARAVRRASVPRTEPRSPRNALAAAAVDVIGATLTLRQRLPVRAVRADPVSATEGFRRGVEMVPCLAEASRRQGARLVVWGGAAVDAWIGRPARVRHDIDLVLADGAPDALEWLAEETARAGFTHAIHLPGCFLRAVRADTTVEIARAVRDTDDRQLIGLAFCLIRLDDEGLNGGEQELLGVPIQVMDPDYLLAVKLLCGRVANSLFIRSEHRRQRRHLIDVRALRECASMARARDIISAGHLEYGLLEAYPASLAAEDLRLALQRRPHVGGRR